MNSEILKKYDVNFYTAGDGTKLTNGSNNAISSYIYIWRQIDNIGDFLLDIDRCLDGRFESVEDPDYSDGLTRMYGALTCNSLIITSELGRNPIEIPLADFKVLLLSWREFLLS